MLIIKNKKSYYTIDHDYHEKYTKVELPQPVPKITQPYMLSFSKWKQKYADDIEQLVNEMVDVIITISSEKYICHINIGQLKKDFIAKLYNTSHNRYKCF